MKILYLHQYFNTPAMPGSTRSFEFAKRLVARGDTVYMVTTNWQGKYRVFMVRDYYWWKIEFRFNYCEQYTLNRRHPRYNA